MKVKELIRFLETCPADAPVFGWQPVFDAPFEFELSDEVRFNQEEGRAELW